MPRTCPRPVPAQPRRSGLAAEPGDQLAPPRLRHQHRGGTTPSRPLRYPATASQDHLTLPTPCPRYTASRRAEAIRPLFDALLENVDDGFPARPSMCRPRRKSSSADADSPIAMHACCSDALAPDRHDHDLRSGFERHPASGTSRLRGRRPPPCRDLPPDAGPCRAPCAVAGLTAVGSQAGEERPEGRSKIWGGGRPARSVRDDGWLE